MWIDGSGTWRNDATRAARRRARVRRTAIRMAQAQTVEIKRFMDVSPLPPFVWNPNAEPFYFQAEMDEQISPLCSQEDVCGLVLDYLVGPSAEVSQTMADGDESFFMCERAWEDCGEDKTDTSIDAAIGVSTAVPVVPVSVQPSWSDSEILPAEVSEAFGVSTAVPGVPVSVQPCSLAQEVAHAYSNDNQLAAIHRASDGHDVVLSSSTSSFGVTLAEPGVPDSDQPSNCGKHQAGDEHAMPASVKIHKPPVSPLRSILKKGPNSSRNIVDFDQTSGATSQAPSSTSSRPATCYLSLGDLDRMGAVSKQYLRITAGLIDGAKESDCNDTDGGSVDWAEVGCSVCGRQDVLPGDDICVGCANIGSGLGEGELCAVCGSAEVFPRDFLCPECDCAQL